MARPNCNAPRAASNNLFGHPCRGVPPWAPRGATTWQRRPRAGIGACPYGRRPNMWCVSALGLCVAHGCPGQQLPGSGDGA
jgi:hypothetical protein